MQLSALASEASIFSGVWLQRFTTVKVFRINDGWVLNHKLDIYIALSKPQGTLWERISRAIRMTGWEDCHEIWTWHGHWIHELTVKIFTRMETRPLLHAWRWGLVRPEHSASDYGQVMSAGLLPLKICLCSIKQTTLKLIQESISKLSKPKTIKKKNRHQWGEGWSRSRVCYKTGG